VSATYDSFSLFFLALDRRVELAFASAVSDFPALALVDLVWALPAAVLALVDVADFLREDPGVEAARLFVGDLVETLRVRAGAAGFSSSPVRPRRVGSSFPRGAFGAGAGSARGLGLGRPSHLGISPRESETGFWAW